MLTKEQLIGAALEYHDRGWSVIPLCWPSHPPGYPAHHRCALGRQGKLPLVAWKEHQVKPAMSWQIKKWWRLYPFANVGVVMGQVSRLVAWDVDDAETAARLESIMGEDLHRTLAFATGGGGRRYLYSWPGDAPPPPAHFQTGGKPLTFLGEGSYSVMPPSQHLNGYQYVWLEAHGPDQVEVAVAPDNMVRYLLDARGEDRKRGVWGPPRAAVPAGSCLERAVIRAMAWARKHPPAIAGQGGRVVAFELACALIHGFGLPAEVARDIMEGEWNERCKPEWSEGELWERIKSARDTGSYPRIEERPYQEGK